MFHSLKIFLVFLLAFLFSAPLWAVEDEGGGYSTYSCPDIETCLALIPEGTVKEFDTGKIEEALKQKILSFGREALPHLVELLDHPNSNIVVVADDLVGDLPGLSAGDLPLVKEAIRRKREGFGWYIMSYFALVTIGNQEAVNFLASELKTRGNSPSQIGITFSRLGGKGIPALVELLETGALCKEDRCVQVEEIFADMGESAKEAVSLLRRIAKDSENTLRIRKMAIKSLGEIGIVAQDAAPDLLALARQKPEDFRHTVLWALVGMKDPLALEIFNLEWDLNNELDTRLRDLASMREGAYTAGPKILEVLKLSTWDNKVAAARALGFIGYKPAAQYLIEAMNNSQDWRLAYVSAEALGLLHEESAISALETVAKNHWYPVVRQAAEQAIDQIQSKLPWQAKFHRNNFPFDFYYYESISYDVAPCKDYENLREEIDNKREINSVELEGDFYVQYFFGARNFCEFNEEGEIITKHECIKPSRANYPQGAKKVEDGLLLYSDWGEWSGEIVSYKRDNSFQIILQENTEDIHFLEQGIFAITGLAHLFFNEGKIYQLKKNSEKEWVAVPIARLPGAPNYSKKISESEILIHGNGGSIIFDGTPNLKMASCEGQ